MARQNLFWLQLRALIWKNWIVLSRHSFLTVLRCFILPIAYGAFLATAQNFLNRLNNYNLGTAVPIGSLDSKFDGKIKLIWADDTNGTSDPSPAAIIERITSNFSENQRRAVQQVSSSSQFPSECPQNFNLFSQCFAAVGFSDIPASGKGTINYTISADAGLAFIDVVHHTSDYEERILPLQWAIDNAIIELQTGVTLQTPLEWPFNQETNEEQKTRIRLSYIRGIRELLGLAFFISFVGISYQLPGAISGERALLLTEHMKAMGLLDSARIISWHLGISLTYLPAWVIVALTWKFRLFVHTNAAIIIILHVLFGLVLASWSFIIAAPFGKSPQLAAVVTTFLAIVFAILALVIKSTGSGILVILSLIFPPMFYIFALKTICGYENHEIGTNILKGDPDRGMVLLPLLVAAVIDVILWPYLGALLERHLYDIRTPSSVSSNKNRWLFWKKTTQARSTVQLPDDIAVSVRGLTKTYKAPRFSSKEDVTAVSNLDLDIPKTGIFVLLGSNGAGKSTSLSVIAGLSSITTGTVTFENGASRPSRGSLGIVPQKNVLFPELTCLQSLRVWRAVKWSENSSSDENLEQLLCDCDLEKKINANASTLSGGQKRKLQLAIGLLGGSKIVLVDECTSGVDPLSRRALWKTLTSFRNDRTIVFTTHFLDEADLLADHIAILAAPGKVVASGSPVSLKRDLGEGYSINVLFNDHIDDQKFKNSTPAREELLKSIRTVVPGVYVSAPSPQHISYHLKTRDGDAVRQTLELIDATVEAGHASSYEIIGTTIEDIFLDLMNKPENQMNKHNNKSDAEEEKDSRDTISPSPSKEISMNLPSGKPVSPLKQAFTVLYKRLLIGKRSWLTPILTIGIAVAGSCIPLVFIKGRSQLCVKAFGNSTFQVPLYLPVSPIVPFTFGPSSRVLTSPPDIVSILGSSADLLRVTNVADNATFVNDITQNFRNLSLGGVSLDLESGASLFAWEATPPGITGPSMLNLVSNIWYNRALNSSGNGDRAPSIIRASYASFPPVAAGTLVSLKWIIFFGAVMSVYPAFFSLYVAKERRSSVQAMQFSNGLTNPIGLWLGHLMYDTITVVILSTIIVIVFAGAASSQFHGLGFLWFILVLYGIVAALFSYCISIVVSSPLAAFATVAGYQFIIFILYISAYLLILTYGKVTESAHLITVTHFTISVVSPVASIARAGLVSVNLFSLLCNGSKPVTASSLGVLTRYGGPILYLFVQGFILLAILVWVDSGTRIPRRLRPRKVSTPSGTAESSREDIREAAEKVEISDDLLRVIHVSKTFSGNQVVDDVSFGVGKDTVFALLGPNGAGKTTTFNMIRGDIIPDIGDILINGSSVIRDPRTARSSLGVCPQFTAIDSQLTVREHLLIYGRLKGLGTGQELQQSIESVMQGTSLWMYADRLASALSGGNQRKLALAIALIGNPSVILIDEFSTGIDPKMKRDMWQTLRVVAVGKAVVVTTHSMEEASALANSVGILAKSMLALGTTQSLSDRYAIYEVHFSCRTRDEVVKAQTLMSLIPGSRMADDVATRFEVPIASDTGITLAQLFNTLSSNGDFTEYTVERASLESVFLKVIRENNIREADSEQSQKKSWLKWRC